MDLLTKRQKQCLDAIVQHQERTGMAPTYRELGRKLGIDSTQAVSDHLAALERKGYLKIRSTARGIELSKEVRATQGIPILGRIAAGTPIETLENYEGQVDIVAMYGSYPDVFAVRIAGDSMTDAGILDGDLAIIRAASRVENGTIAAVAIDNEATIKKFHREHGAVTLIPANKKYAPRIYHEGSGEIRLLGRVIGVIRRMK